MSAGQLSAILWKLDQGWLDDWADLCEYALCDDTLMSLYSSRATRVLQATWKVKPNEFGGSDAQLAAEFCNEQMGKLRNFNDALRYMMHASAVGLSANEKEWDAYRAPTGQITYYLRQLHFRHPHRFRYDEQWRPRLWDQGKRIKPDGMWGMPLDPRKWLIYQHYEIVGYPNVSGFMRGAIWVWLFMRWADKFGIQSLEKFGNPFLYAQVPPNTPLATREKVRQDLQDLSNDHAGVIEAGITIMNMAGMSGQTESLHGSFMDRYQARLARLILGSSDAADPGKNGSNAAVATRVGATADPRMVVDGVGIGEAWASQVFGWMLEFNRHRFGGKLLPTPQFVALTAADEVKTDIQDLAEQSGGPNGGPPSGKGPSDGGGLADVMDKAVAAQEAQKAQQAIAQDESRALSDGPPVASDPKALSRSSQGRRTANQKSTRTNSRQTPTSQTSTPSQTSFAGILRDVLADRQR
jgi:phage gp29-like protein